MSTNYGPTTILAVAIVAGVVLGGGAVVAFDAADPGGDGNVGEPTDVDESSQGLATFESEEAYREYHQRGTAGAGWVPTTVDPTLGERQSGGVAVAEDAATDAPGDAGVDDGDTSGGAGGATEDAPRSSETNVQVQGVDEFDVLETDGRWAYYAGWERWGEEGVGDPAVIDTTPPEAPELAGSISAGDQLVLDGDTLLSLESDAVYGYDVSDPEDPSLRWEHSLNHTVETARVANGTLYLVLRDDPRGGHPCPVEPMGGATARVPCTDVYRPADGDGGDTTYTAVAMNATTGSVGDRVSFAGSGSNTVVYVDHDAIYLTYEDSPSYAETRTRFLLGPGSVHLDERAIDRIEEIRTFNLTPDAARIEIESTVRQRIQRLPQERREAVATGLQESYRTWLSEHQRELLRTGIVRIGADGTELAVGETGEVPGRVLDQFSISERGGYLHVATTVNPTGTQWENDLYALDSDLEVADSVTGMGTDQRIYSVRYVGDRAYVTTFRQVDPFHVIDVSDPENLELQGELELPGFSTYLHPMGEDRILGIGEEDGQVTATMFDANDPQNPEIAGQIHLDDRWSAVSQSHHAFLLDERHRVFFVPGSEGGHVVSYEDGLELETTVETGGPAVRAAYVGDYLYVFGTDELVVVDESDWSAVERLELR